MKNMRWCEAEGKVNEGWMDIWEGVLTVVFGEVIWSE